MTMRRRPSPPSTGSGRRSGSPCACCRCRILLQAKNNLGARCNGLAFRLEQRIVVSDILSSNVMFKSDHVSQPIDEALTVSEGRGGAAGGWISKGDLDG